MIFHFIKYDIKRYAKLFLALLCAFLLLTLFFAWVCINNAKHSPGTDELYLKAIDFNTVAAVVFTVVTLLYLGYYILSSTLGKTVNIVRLKNYNVVKLLLLRIAFAAIVLICVLMLSGLVVSIPAIAYKNNQNPLYIKQNFDNHIYIWTEFAHLKLLELLDYCFSFTVVIAVLSAAGLWLKSSYREYIISNIIAVILLFFTLFILKTWVSAFADGSVLDFNGNGYPLYTVYFMMSDYLNMVSLVLNILIFTLSMLWFNKNFYRTELV